MNMWEGFSEVSKITTSWFWCGQLKGDSRIPSSSLKTGRLFADSPRNHVLQIPILQSCQSNQCWWKQLQISRNSRGGRPQWPHPIPSFWKERAHLEALQHRTHETVRSPSLRLQQGQSALSCLKVGLKRMMRISKSTEQASRHDIEIRVCPWSKKIA